MVWNAVAEIRRSRHVSQVELARSISVSRQTIHAIETGRYVPSVELALRLAQYFQLAVEDLFRLEEE